MNAFSALESLDAAIAAEVQRVYGSLRASNGGGRTRRRPPLRPLYRLTPVSLEPLEQRMLIDNGVLSPGLELQLFGSNLDPNAMICMDLTDPGFSSTSTGAAANQFNLTDTSVSDAVTGETYSTFRARYSGFLDIGAADSTAGNKAGKYFFQVQNGDGAILKIDDTYVLLLPSFFGDNTLNGKVDGNDIGLMITYGYFQANGAGPTCPFGWNGFDMDGNGKVDSNDIGIMIMGGYYNANATRTAHAIDNTVNSDTADPSGDPNINLFTDVGIDLGIGHHKFEYQYFKYNNNETGATSFMQWARAGENFHTIDPSFFSHTPLAAPDQPSAAALPGAATPTIALAWQAPATRVDGAAGAITYRVFRGDSARFRPTSLNCITEGLAAAGFTDTGTNNTSNTTWADTSPLAPGTTYYYKITAIDSAGQSLPSRAVAATTFSTLIGSSSTKVSVNGDATVDEGTPYTLNLHITAATGATPITSWTIHWGDGATSNPDGSLDSVTHPYAAGTSDYTITASATDGTHTFDAPTLGVAVLPGPSVATAAAAGPSTVTGTTTNLTVLGASPTGEPNLTYAWVATTVPAGAPDPFFSANGDNASKAATATFFQAGTYTLEAQISDGVLTTISAVTVQVNPTLTSVFPWPGAGANAAAAVVASDGTYQLNAIAQDQFGNALTTQPGISWSVADATQGSVNSTTGLYTPPTGASTNDAFTVTASATVSGHTANAPVTISVGTAATIAPAAVSYLTAQAEDGTDAQISWVNNDTSAAGFLIEASSDNGTTYNPIGTPGPDNTSFLATNLCSNMAYIFRVTPFNAVGAGTPSTTSAATTTTDASTAGWYKVAFNDPSNPSATTEPFVYSGSGTPTGNLQLTNAGQSTDGWFQADSAADAARKALTGSLSDGNGNTFTFPGEGAFRYVPDFQIGSNDIGPAVVFERPDSLPGSNANDSYVALNVVRDEVFVQASTDGSAVTGFLPPPNSSVVGFFNRAAPGELSTAFTATIAWADHTTTPGLITDTGEGFYVSVVRPTGESLDAYTFTVTHAITGVQGIDGIGIPLPASSSSPTKIHPNSVNPPAPVWRSPAAKPYNGTSVRLKFKTGETNTKNGQQYNDIYYLYRSRYTAVIDGPRNAVDRVTIDGHPVYGQRDPAGQAINFIFTDTSDTRTGDTTRTDDTRLLPGVTYYYKIVASRGSLPSNPSGSNSVSMPMDIVGAATNITVAATGASYAGSPGYPASTAAIDNSSATLPNAHKVSWQWNGTVPSGAVLSFTLERMGSDGTVVTLFQSKPSTATELNKNGTSYSYSDPTGIDNTNDPKIYYYAVTANIDSVRAFPTPLALAPQAYYIEGANADNSGQGLRYLFDNKMQGELHYFAETTPVSTITAALQHQVGGARVLFGFSVGGYVATLVTGIHVDYMALFDPVPYPWPDQTFIDPTELTNPATGYYGLTIPGNVSDADDWYNDRYDSASDNSTYIESITRDPNNLTHAVVKFHQAPAELANWALPAGVGTGLLITGSTVAAYNDGFVITAVTSDTATINMGSDPGANVTGSISWQHKQEGLPSTKMANRINNWHPYGSYHGGQLVNHDVWEGDSTVGFPGVIAKVRALTWTF